MCSLPKTINQPFLPSQLRQQIDISNVGTTMRTTLMHVFPKTRSISSTSLTDFVQDVWQSNPVFLRCSTQLLNFSFPFCPTLFLLKYPSISRNQRGYDDTNRTDQWPSNISKRHRFNGKIKPDNRSNKGQIRNGDHPPEKCRKGIQNNHRQPRRSIFHSSLVPKYYADKNNHIRVTIAS